MVRIGYWLAIDDGRVVDAVVLEDEGFVESKYADQILECTVNGPGFCWVE